MRIFRFMAATVAMLALAGCSKPPVVNQFTKADVESITKAVQDVRAAYNAKDADKVAALFAPDETARCRLEGASDVSVA